MLRMLPILLLGVIAGLLLFPLVNRWQSQDDTQSPAKVTSPASLAGSRQNAIVQAIKKVAPSVVSINTEFVQENPRFPDPFFEFSHPELRKIPGIGSGFVIQADGYILTNSHVVDGARNISVTFPDGRQFDVLEVLIDRELDLAVIHVDAENLAVPEMGNSEEVILGEWAIALGNPFGLRFEDFNPTVTVGVISALNRMVRPEEDERAYKGMIQTDASINPGNSGGPLVNSSGQIIGINTFIFSQGGALGIGFALPINRAIDAARQLIDRGSREFWTGLDIHSITPHIARTLRLNTVRGALITVVEPLSPGESAGLLPGDVIVAVNNAHINSSDDVINAFREAAVGDTFNLKIMRGRIIRGQGGIFDATLVLEPDPRGEE